MAIKQNTSIGSTKYNENFEKIFGTKEERAARHAKEKAEIEAKEVQMARASKTAYVNGTFEPFKSPIDGSIISCPSQLRNHNKQHGVTDIRDYGDEWFRKRGEEMYNEKIGKTAQAKRERQEIVVEQLHRHGLLR